MHTALQSAPYPASRRPVSTDWSAVHAGLARSSLSGVALRLALYLFAKAGVTGHRSWCLPVEAMATDLKVSRNTISSALRELVDAGLIRRSASTRRGAPTRTTLLIAVRQIGVTQVGSVPICQIGVAQVEPPSITMPPPAPLVVGHADPGAMTPTGHTSDALRPRTSMGQGPLHSSNALDTETTPPPPTVSAQRPAMSLDELRALQAFFLALPAPVSSALETAKALRDPAALVIDPDWHLSDQQIRWLRNAIPKPEPRPERAANAVPRVTCEIEPIPSDLAETLLSWLPTISRAAGSERRAAELLDEIACMVMLGGLGRGDRIGGARAGLALVRAGRWNRPKMMSGAWHGAVLRAVASRPETH